MAHYEYFRNRQCEYFPCHTGVDPENFNCMFCYCPLYCLGDKCGGSFRYTESGIKDCSRCVKPHIRENYSRICEEMKQVTELVKISKEEE